MFSIEFEIPQELLEPKYKHVHHADVLKFLERGRLALLEHIGEPTEKLMARGLFLVITSITVKYLRELREGKVTVTCDTARCEGRDIIVTQRVLNFRGKTAVEASVVSVFMDGTTRRAVEPPPDFVNSFRRN